ncbi:MAG TPA: TOBE domain-containing protein, partial [Rhodobacteraceae bacterium]|nr:TOBE domain-containing protein [Paracoccaceae bacterium]
YESPNSRYVADFIGDVNLIEGRVTSVENGLVRLGWAGGKDDLLISSDMAVNTGDRLWFAMRPEKIHISSGPPEQADNTVGGTVLDIAYAGNTTTYHVDIGNGLIIKTQETNRRHRVNRTITWEDRVWLGWTRNAGVLLRE